MRRRHSASFFRMCLASSSCSSFTSLCRGTGCDIPLFGFRYQSCFPPWRTSEHPSASSLRIRSVRFILFSLHVFPSDTDDGHHRQNHEHNLEDAPDRVPDLVELALGWQPETHTLDHGLADYLVGRAGFCLLASRPLFPVPIYSLGREASRRPSDSFHFTSTTTAWRARHWM